MSFLLTGVRENFALLSALGQTNYRNALVHSLWGHQDTVIPTASVLTMNATPVTVVSAPGAGLAVIPIAMYSSMVYNSTTYSTNSSGASLKYTDGSGVAAGLTLTQAYLQMTATSSLYVHQTTTAGFIPTANAPVVLVAASTDPTTGNSDIKVRVWYVLVESPLTFT